MITRADRNVFATDLTLLLHASRLSAVVARSAMETQLQPQLGTRQPGVISSYTTSDLHAGCPALAESGDLSRRRRDRGTPHHHDKCFADLRSRMLERLEASSYPQSSSTTTIVAHYISRITRQSASAAHKRNYKTSKADTSGFGLPKHLASFLSRDISTVCFAIARKSFVPCSARQ
jgi:hypothetical protein